MECKKHNKLVNIKKKKKRNGLTDKENDKLVVTRGRQVEGGPK